MDFHILGPIGAFADGVRVELGRRQERRLLGLLLLESGHALPIDRLVGLLWEDGSPADPRAALHTHMARLRSRLAPYGVHVESLGPAYRLDTPRDSVDANKFVDLVAEATATNNAEVKAARLGEALALWRGELLAGDMADSVRERLGQHLESLRLRAIEQKAVADLATGRHGQVVTDLSRVIEQHSTRELLVGLLMTALYRCGRQAEALALFRATRDQLVEALGIDAGPELRRLHEQVLRHDPGLAWQDPLPRQLPLDVHGFTGRRAELGQLDLARANGKVVVTGMGGVGKTALAVHWAHRVHADFPDGQLFVDLHGFDPSSAPVLPEDAIRGFLEPLGLTTAQVPATPEAQAALYRATLAGKRMLIVLDNARDADQVRPLLPATPGCVVVITSRDLLTGLIAADGATPVTVEPLPQADARGMLAARIDTPQVAAEPEAVDEIIAACARLPLALTIVAAQAVTRPGVPLSGLAADLRASRGLDAFDIGDTTADVRGVFSWSYRLLSPAAARVFRLLGLLPGPDTALPAIASLAGQAEPQVRPLVAELVRHHLVIQQTNGRYALHDLVGAFAVELVEPDAERETATRRVLDHYLHAGHLAALRYSPTRDPLPMPAPPHGITLPTIGDREAGLAWLVDEYRVLLTAIRFATSHGYDEHARPLSWALEDFFATRGLWHDWCEIGGIALAAAQRTGDLMGQAVAQRSLGRAHGRANGFSRAEEHCRQAVELFAALDDPAGQAHAHTAYGFITERLGRLDDTLFHTERALELFRRAGHAVGEARAVNNLGWYHALRGEHEVAIRYCQEAVELQRKAGNRTSEANAWDSLGYIHHQRGALRDAIECYSEALALNRSDGHRSDEAETLESIGNVCQTAGDLDRARSAWTEALEIFDELDPPNAARLRDKLSING